MEMQMSGQNNRIGSLVHGVQTQLTDVRVLVVGMGGIGCEVLKVLGKMPIGAIHILDMDTIEISNLNRQFLFKTIHKGMSKSLVAKEAILKLNPALNIEAHHVNIKELKISFFKQFSFIIMALDNIDARNYVNRIGVRLSIPIIDAGTLAYKGNVTTILTQQSRCYACEPKSSNQKVYPVCTIRSRPEKPIHCIVWAKMLFEVVFGGNTENDMNDLSVLAEKDELTILTQLFQKDIENIKTSKEDSEQNKLTEAYLKKINSVPSELLMSCLEVKLMAGFSQFDVVQSTERNVSLFVQALGRLKAEKGQHGQVLFEKDDDNIIFFISSAANLRMSCFGIEQQSFNQIKNMAGNIVPAIASTNSIVSGVEIIEMLKYVRGRKEQMKCYFIQNQANKIMPLRLETPIQKCTVCSLDAIPVVIEGDFEKLKLKEVIEVIESRSPGLSEFSVNQGSKEIYNSEEPREVLLAKTMFELCEGYEFDLVLTDEDNMKNVCTIWMIHNDLIQEIAVTNGDKLIPKPLDDQVMQDEAAGKHPEPADDSDVVMFDDQDSSLEMLEPHKRPLQSEPMLDQLKKKKKLE